MKHEKLLAAMSGLTSGRRDKTSIVKQSPESGKGLRMALVIHPSGRYLVMDERTIAYRRHHS